MEPPGGEPDTAGECADRGGRDDVRDVPPVFLFIFLGAPYIETLRSHRGLDGALRSVTAAVVGVVLNLALVFGAAVLFPFDGAGGVDWLAAAIAAVAFVALWRLRTEVLWVVLGGGVLGLLHGLT